MSTNRQQQRRSTLARMTGNIAAGLVTDENAEVPEIAFVSLNLAERILKLIEERHPDQPDDYVGRRRAIIVKGLTDDYRISKKSGYYDTTDFQEAIEAAFDAGVEAQKMS